MKLRETVLRFILGVFLVVSVAVGWRVGLLFNSPGLKPVPNQTLSLPDAPVRIRRVLLGNAEQVDLRCVPACTHFGVDERGYYLKATADQETIDFAIRSYYVAPVDPMHADVQRMLEGLPAAWRLSHPDKLSWYAGGLGDDGSVGSWNVLGVEERSGTIYFFTVCWDYAP